MKKLSRNFPVKNEQAVLIFHWANISECVFSDIAVQILGVCDIIKVQI